MSSKIDDLENAVSHTIRYISRLKKESKTSSAQGPQGVDSATSNDSRISELTEENNRLLAERKEVRRRLRTVLREIDKVK